MTGTLKLDHNQENIAKAFGLSEYDEHYVKAAIVFETISNHLKVADLYDDVDEAPKEFRCATGILEATLRHATSQEMRDYMLLNFYTGYHGTHESMQYLLEGLKDQDKDKKSDKTGGDPMKGIMQKMVMMLKAQGLKHTIDLIRKVNHDFRKFVAEVLPADKFEERKQQADGIDDMLKGLLGGSDEDDE